LNQTLNNCAKTFLNSAKLPFFLKKKILGFRYSICAMCFAHLFNLNPHQSINNNSNNNNIPYELFFKKKKKKKKKKNCLYFSSEWFLVVRYSFIIIIMLTNLKIILNPAFS